MNREEFDKLYLGKAVHCDTKEKAKEFLALADSFGHKWFSGISPIGRSYWETHKEETCYKITHKGLTYSDTNYFIQEGYKIIEYQPSLKEQICKEENINDIIEEIKTKLSEINLLLNRLEKKKKGE